MAQDRILQKCIVFLFYRSLPPTLWMPSGIWNHSDFLWPGASSELFGVLFIILVPVRPHSLVPGHLPTPLLALIDLVHYCLINFASLYLHLSFSLRVIEGIFIGHGVGGNLESKSAQPRGGRQRPVSPFPWLLICLVLLNAPHLHGITVSGFSLIIHLDQSQGHCFLLSTLHIWSSWPPW